MENILEMYKAENIWDMILGKKIKEGEANEKYYIDCAKQFGLLCSITIAGKPLPDLSLPVPISEEFTDTYNQISLELLNRIDTNGKISLQDIGNVIYAQGKFTDAIAAICYENTYVINSQLALDGNPIELYIENRTKIINNYAACLNALRHAYKTETIHSIFTQNKKNNVK